MTSIYHRFSDTLLDAYFTLVQKTVSGMDGFSMT